MNIDHQQIHTPVLLEEVLQYLAPEKGQNLLDVTAGYGGHAAAILDITKQFSDSVLVDRDSNATAHLKKRFLNDVSIIQNDFASASKKLAAQGKQFDLILADLGVSSPHLDNADRGFSLRSDGPLDMRMDRTAGKTAAELVNGSTEEELVNILRTYGEEPHARRIVRAIIDKRPINTTQQLAELIAKVYGGRGRYKVHPATKTFQALRISVNDELGQLTISLPLWLKMLNKDGRIAVISFHSLEDRIVKQFISDHGGNRYDAELTILTKKPIVSAKTELVNNPRARSAKLRAAVKK